MDATGAKLSSLTRRVDIVDSRIWSTPPFKNVHVSSRFDVGGMFAESLAGAAENEAMMEMRGESSESIRQTRFSLEMVSPPRLSHAPRLCYFQGSRFNTSNLLRRDGESSKDLVQTMLFHSTYVPQPRRSHLNLRQPLIVTISAPIIPERLMIRSCVNFLSTREPYLPRDLIWVQLDMNTWSTYATINRCARSQSKNHYLPLILSDS